MEREARDTWFQEAKSSRAGHQNEWVTNKKKDFDTQKVKTTISAPWKWIKVLCTTWLSIFWINPAKLVDPFLERAKHETKCVKVFCFVCLFYQPMFYEFVIPCRKVIRSQESSERQMPSEICVKTWCQLQPSPGNIFYIISFIKIF